MKIALLSAAVNGDNSGDAIIETAVRRLVKAEQFTRFPLTTPLSEKDLAEINTHDRLLICGTNLYQHVFACNITKEVVQKIKIPVIPFGIGSSAAIGKIPVMNEEGVKTVRAIHKTCRQSSVRDMASYKFLKSIGVDNVRLTGCPVLFHGLSCPEFDLKGEGYTLTPRARLLHIEDKWDKRQEETLERLSAYYRPKLVLQSPYDIPVAQRLADKYNLEVIMDEHWQADKYIDLAKSQYINTGFRLHFAMLSISYGKPAFLVSHDSRASEFCELIDIPLIDIKNYSDNGLIVQIDTKCFNASGVQKRWNELSCEMNSFMAENEIASSLAVPAKRTASVKENPKKKPEVLLLIDKPNWAFDHSAKHIADVLKDDFNFHFAYVAEQPKLDASKYDLLYVFFWGEDYYKRFGFRKEQIIKELSSHRWEDNPLYGPCTPKELVEKYLSDAGTVICTSHRLLNTITDIHPHVLHTPNGFSHKQFFRKKERTGELSVGWAGNIKDSVKGFNELVKPACEGKYKLYSAPGNFSHRQMNGFYNQLDVFVVSSKNEGEPLTLVESMAAGCFPVSTDVGIAPELIRNGSNGIILKERSQEELEKALAWCKENITHVRKMGAENARMMLREREWNITARFFKYAFLDAYKRSAKFRNDDVSFDTDIHNFKKFCSLFQHYGLTQVHGITLHGNTNTLFEYNGEPVEYEHTENISRLPYNRIKELSENKPFAGRKDLVDYLNASRDEIALHGLFHTDYSKMTEEEQERDISEGLSQLKKLFPRKEIKYFIPPFNRTNAFTHKVCAAQGLEVLGTDGKHLEEEASSNAPFVHGAWHRYHHHRFYSETKFSYYKLSLEKLENYFSNHLQPEIYLWDKVPAPIEAPQMSETLFGKVKRKFADLIKS
jgi:glycosyltransferase involved in cell wall biosynthesis